MRVSTPALTVLFLHLTGVLTQSCSGVSFEDVCCNGRITGDSSSSNGLDGLVCCQGDPDDSLQISPGAPTTCTAGTAIPMTALASSQSGSSRSSTNMAATTTSTGLTTSTGAMTTSAGTITTTSSLPTSTNTGGFAPTQAPWAAAAVIAGGLAALV